MEVLSKYAAKQKAKAEGRWVAPVVEVGVRVDLTGAKKPEVEEEEEFTDLGKLPGLCAEHLRTAVEALQKATNIAVEMERIAGPAMQKQEPRGIKGACASGVVRFRKLAKRAERMK